MTIFYIAEMNLKGKQILRNIKVFLTFIARSDIERWLSGNNILILSYDVTVIQWITSCHKNRMTARVVTLWCEHVTSSTTSVSTMRFHIELMFILKAITSRFIVSYDKQNLTLVDILYEIYKLAEGSFHKFHMK